MKFIMIHAVTIPTENDRVVQTGSNEQHEKRILHDQSWPYKHSMKCAYLPPITNGIGHHYNTSVLASLADVEQQIGSQK
jgi:hypothetical protein